MARGAFCAIETHVLVVLRGGAERRGPFTHPCTRYRSYGLADHLHHQLGSPEAPHHAGSFSPYASRGPPGR